MTPKEKAKELVGIYQLATMSKATAKGCALICVDEMLGITPMYTGNLNQKWKFLKEVKQEIEKL